MNRQPLYLLTDDNYAAVGAVAVENGRFIGRDTAGHILFNRKSLSGVDQAAKRHGRLVSSAWYGVKP